MRKAVFLCEKCLEEFEVELVAKNEARERNIRITAMRCPKCGSTQVHETKKYY